MARSNFKLALRTVVYCASILFVVILLVLAAQPISKSFSRSEHKELLTELYNDSIAIRLRNESKQECTTGSPDYYWICGVVVEADRSQSQGYCSTPDRPIYYGALDEASQADLSLGDLKFEHIVRISNAVISPTNSETPYAYSQVFPPQEILARKPELTDDTSDTEYSWVSYQGIAVLFASGSRRWKLTPEERSNLPLYAIFNHPDFPLRISRPIPRPEIADWRLFMDTAISEVSKSVISYEAKQGCSQPPETVRFLYNIHNAGKLKALRDWVREHHTSLTPK